MHFLVESGVNEAGEFADATHDKSLDCFVERTQLDQSHSVLILSRCVALAVGGRGG